MRPHALALSIPLALAAACGDQREAVLDYTVNDSTPAAPLRALQVFEINAQDMSSGAIAVVWGDQVPMPDRGSSTFSDEVPPPFRLCAVALGEEEGQLFHALSEPVQLILDETVSVVLTLTPVDEGGGVPAPCGSAVQPWPDGV
jgi:hypothetical protein